MGVFSQCLLITSSITKNNLKLQLHVARPSGALNIDRKSTFRIFPIDVLRLTNENIRSRNSWYAADEVSFSSGLKSCCIVKLPVTTALYAAGVGVTVTTEVVGVGVKIGVKVKVTVGVGVGVTTEKSSTL